MQELHREGRDQGDRRLQLLPRPAGRPHRPQRDHPRGQPDRDPPVLPARRRPGAHARARRADRVVGRRSPRARTTCSPTRSSAEIGERARQVRRPGRAALADPARRRRHPQVGPPRAHGARTSTSSTSSSPTTRWPASPPWTPAAPCSSTTATRRWSAWLGNGAADTAETHSHCRRRPRDALGRPRDARPRTLRTECREHATMVDATAPRRAERRTSCVSACWLEPPLGRSPDRRVLAVLTQPARPSPRRPPPRAGRRRSCWPTSPGRARTTTTAAAATSRSATPRSRRR